MRRQAAGRFWSGVVGLVLLASAGCQRAREFYFLRDGDLSHYQNVATSIDVAHEPVSAPADLQEALPPRTLWTHEPTDYWDLSLEEAIQLALANSEVMRDLGGRVVTQPTRTVTTYEPAIQETDPRYGVEGALSQFDAQFSTQLFWERNDRIINNVFLGGGTRAFQQDIGRFRSELSKRAATGTRFAVRHNVDYEWNNAPANLFPSAWDVTLEAEVRHPLLQNGGVQFNRIAGPDAMPGFYFRSGVLLARVDQDIRLADFEAGVRDLVNNVENAYWDLYYAYRDLDAKIAARDSALATWRRIQRLRAAGAVGGEAANEARASQQYFFFRAEVENALSGMPAGSSQAGLGTRSGSFIGSGGLYAREANLRYLLGLPVNDGRLIRPRDEPTSARVVFDWYESLAEALTRRVELRQQRWRVKRRELELIAARNFLLPRLDAVARYRWRGFGDDLIDPDSSSAPPLDNAYQSLTDGDLQEWQLGFLFSMPLGFREGHAAVRNAEQKLARERAILAEQQRKIAHDLAATLRELHRAYNVTQTNYNRRLRAAARVEAVRRELEEAQRTTVDRLLDAQEDLAEAEVAYFRSLVEYNVAIKAVHYEKGSLLDFNEVYLTEGPWPGKAYEDAKRLARRAATLPMDYRMTIPHPVSLGAYSQQQDNARAGRVPAEAVAPLGSPDARQNLPGKMPHDGGETLPPGENARPLPQDGGLQDRSGATPTTPPVRWSGAPPMRLADAFSGPPPGYMPKEPILRPARRDVGFNSRDPVAAARGGFGGAEGGRAEAAFAAPASHGPSAPVGFRSSVIRAMTSHLGPDEQKNRPAAYRMDSDGPAAPSHSIEPSAAPLSPSKAGRTATGGSTAGPPSAHVDSQSAATKQAAPGFSGMRFQTNDGSLRSTHAVDPRPQSAPLKMRGASPGGQPVRLPGVGMRAESPSAR